MGRRGKVVSKKEALWLISARLRNPELEDGMLVKLLNVYYTLLTSLEGPTPDRPGPDLDALVLAVERRRQKAQKENS